MGIFPSLYEQRRQERNHYSLIAIMAILTVITCHNGHKRPFMAMIEHPMTIDGHRGLSITKTAIYFLTVLKLRSVCRVRTHPSSCSTGTKQDTGQRRIGTDVVEEEAIDA